MLWRTLAGYIVDDGVAAMISLRAVRGSSPREAGARMVMRRDGAFLGSIGGGALEFEALKTAKELVERSAPQGLRKRQALGPDLGQCCGGNVEISIEVFTRADLAWITALKQAEAGGNTVQTAGREDKAGRVIRRVLVSPDAAEALNDDEIIETFGIGATPVLLFGAGHVGRALALALAPLPFSVTWIDGREGAFPGAVPANMRLLCETDPEIALRGVPAGALVVVMTHSHALDLAIVASALRTAGLGYVGLIGSATKRARFIGQLRAAGFDAADLDRLTCPIGGGLLTDKTPAAIALCVAVDLMQQRQKMALEAV